MTSTTRRMVEEAKKQMAKGAHPLAALEMARSKVPHAPAAAALATKILAALAA